jgi:hypothetical protein
MIVLVGILTLLTVFNGSTSHIFAQENAKNTSYEFAVDPLNASYSIEGNTIRLQDGRSEMISTPHSATTTKTAVYGKTVYGDLDGDGIEDAAILLIHDPGGSGTFFYVAGALNINGKFQGTNAMLLGDRITPRDLQIRNGVLIAKYADRRPGEPMIAPPSVFISKYLILKDDQLKGIASLGVGDRVVEGWVTIGHEVRSFKPCQQKKELWLRRDSPALSQIMVAYGEVRPNSKPYRPLFMVLAGKRTIPSTNGFGAEYEAAFIATQLVRVIPDGSCSRESRTSNSSGINEGIGFLTRIHEKITFDVASLDDDGLYGPPNGKRALSYEFCIPDIERYKSKVKRLDLTLQCMSESPGRIGCGTHENLCIGSTHQKNFRDVLRDVAELTYVTRIDQSFFE